MNYPNSQYDYFLDFRDEKNRKYNILGLAERFLNFFNPDRWDGIGVKPKSVDAEHYQRAKIKWGDQTKDYWYLDMWIEFDGFGPEEENGEWNIVAAFDSTGDIALRTDGVGDINAVAEMLAQFLQCDYTYNVKERII